MQKFFLIAIVALAASGYYVYQDPELRAWFDRQTQQLLPEQATHHVMYRWKDAQGQWQVSDSPPGPGIEYETVRYHKDTNLIPSEQLTGKKPD